MTITVKKITLAEQQSQESVPLITENYLNLINGITVECHIRLGTFTMTIAELRQLKQGQTITLQQKTHEPVEILLNNQIIARGELMSVEDCFAVKITEVAS